MSVLRPDNRSAWERSGVTLGAWRRMFGRLTADHIAADHALQTFFERTDRRWTAADAKEFLRQRDAARKLHDDWWNAMNGDGATIRSFVVDRYHLDPDDDHVGP